MIIQEIDNEKKLIFDKYFAEENGNFYFEGMWFRNQQEKNKKQSKWKDESTVRRRYLHFFNTYRIKQVENKNFLALSDVYLVISNTLPKDEILLYKQSVLKALSENNYQKSENNVFFKDYFQVLIFEFDTHPKNIEGNVSFPKNYASIDIVFKSKDNTNWQEHYNRMWEHSTKLFRLPDKRENPHYETDMSKLKQFLPAQIEMGCGPSIEANIPPLYEMHETYRVQNHLTKEFYFANEDTLIQQIIENPQEMYKKFSKVPIACLYAEHTEAYKIFDKAYKQNLFVGEVYNNNFDRLVKRFDISETILRIFEKEKYLPKITFDKNVKSLICIGCHADRRQVQKQAREQGLKVVFVDPEGFDTPNGFVPYEIEGPKDDDIIYKMTFTEFMEKFEEEFLV